jgi:hypothetical protein
MMVVLMCLRMRVSDLIRDIDQTFSIDEGGVS